MPEFERGRRAYDNGALVEAKPVEDNTEPPKPRSRIPFYVVGGIIFVSAIIGLSWWLYARQFITTDDAFIEGHISIVSPKISAHVRKVHVVENQPIKKGDLLIEFDAQELEAKLEQTRALLQTALASRTKASANVALTRKSSQAGLNQAASNLKTAETGIEQTRIASFTKRSSIEQARAQTNTAAANLRQVQAQIPAAEATLAQAKAQVPAVQNKLEIARLEQERNQMLFASGTISRQELELSGKELSVARADLLSADKQIEIAAARLNALHRQVEVEISRLNEAKLSVAAAENDYRQSLAQVDVSASQADESAGRLQEAKSLPERIAVDESDVGAAEAEIARAEAAVTQAEIELQHTKIYAPQDGFVANRVVQEGQLVQPEQSLMAITRSEIWVIANFKETQIEKMKPGQSVDIYVDAYPGALFSGRVESFQAGTGSRFSVLPAENATGNYVKVVQRIPVKIVFDEMPDNKKYLLVPGMSVVPKVKI